MQVSKRFRPALASVVVAVLPWMLMDRAGHSLRSKSSQAIGRFS